MTIKKIGDYTRGEWLALTPDEQEAERSRILLAAIFAPMPEDDDEPSDE